MESFDTTLIFDPLLAFTVACWFCELPPLPPPPPLTHDPAPRPPLPAATLDMAPTKPLAELDKRDRIVIDVPLDNVTVAFPGEPPLPPAPPPVKPEPPFPPSPPVELAPAVLSTFCKSV